MTWTATESRIRSTANVVWVRTRLVVWRHELAKARAAAKKQDDCLTTLRHRDIRQTVKEREVRRKVESANRRAAHLVQFISLATARLEFLNGR